MRDFNFFEPYIENKNRKINGSQLGKILLIAGFSILLLYPFYNVYRIAESNKEAETVIGIVLSPEVQEGKRTIEALVTELEELKVKGKRLEKLTEDFNNNSIISDLLIYTINNQMPDEIFLQHLQISQGHIQLHGIAQKKGAIAQLESNLRRIDQFENIFIPSIMEDTGNYTFTLSFSIKDGDEK